MPLSVAVLCRLLPAWPRHHVRGRHVREGFLSLPQALLAVWEARVLWTAAEPVAPPGQPLWSTLASHLFRTVTAWLLSQLFPSVPLSVSELLLPGRAVLFRRPLSPSWPWWSP